MDLETLYKAVINGKVDAAVAETQKALQAGAAAQVILNESLLPAMQEVGRLFELGEYFLPEMLAGGLAMKSCLAELAPELAEQKDAKPKGRVVLGTVKGDVHDIGKNLVGLMMEGAGFEVTDLGIDVGREKFVEAARGADIVGLSGLVSTTIPEMGHVIKALEEAGLRDQVKVMVGGAPVTQDFADEIGADGYSADAAGAARKAKELLGVE
jgi:5-methyltetrahydrofolate--homocysteine methyltransferase